VRADAGAAAGYVVVFLFMLVPLDGLLNNLPTLNAARVSLSRIEKVMAEFGSLPVPGRAASASCDAGFATLTMRGVTHSYFHERDERMFRMGPVDLTFEPGELVFIVGGNGSGKTTLAKVLTGLYEPESGVIEVDGKPVEANGRAAYRERFTAVFNDFHLFDALLGIVDPNDAARAAADARANALVARLMLDHKVEVVDGAFSTQALDRPTQAARAGRRLSGRPAALSLRRMGRRSGPCVQGGVLRAVAAGTARARQDGDRDHARRPLLPARRSCAQAGERRGGERDTRRRESRIDGPAGERDDRLSHESGGVK
jgi:ABC-type transport system involved in cytochrome bd biosynthesis fused ATPase/permease subunit